MSQSTQIIADDWNHILTRENIATCASKSDIKQIIKNQNKIIDLLNRLVDDKRSDLFIEDNTSQNIERNINQNNKDESKEPENTKKEQLSFSIFSLLNTQEILNQRLKNRKLRQNIPFSFDKEL